MIEFYFIFLLEIIGSWCVTRLVNWLDCSGVEGGGSMDGQMDNPNYSSIISVCKG